MGDSDALAQWLAMHRSLLVSAPAFLIFPLLDCSGLPGTLQGLVSFLVLILQTPGVG